MHMVCGYLYFVGVIVLHTFWLCSALNSRTRSHSPHPTKMIRISSLPYTRRTSQLSSSSNYILDSDDTILNKPIIFLSTPLSWNFISY